MSALRRAEHGVGLLTWTLLQGACPATQLLLPGRLQDRPAQQRGWGQAESGRSMVRRGTKVAGSITRASLLPPSVLVAVPLHHGGTVQ